MNSESRDGLHLLLAAGKVLGTQQECPLLCGEWSVDSPMEAESSTHSPQSIQQKAQSPDTTRASMNGSSSMPNEEAKGDIPSDVDSGYGSKGPSPDSRTYTASSNSHFSNVFYEDFSSYRNVLGASVDIVADIDLTNFNAHRDSKSPNSDGSRTSSDMSWSCGTEDSLPLSPRSCQNLIRSYAKHRTLVSTVHCFYELPLFNANVAGLS